MLFTCLKEQFCNQAKEYVQLIKSSEDIVKKQ